VAYIISFVIKAEKIRFIHMVRYTYYFLSVLNLILAFIVIINFSEETSLKVLEVLKSTMVYALPTLLLETINTYITDLGLFFKNILKRLIDWVYDNSGEIKTEGKIPKPQIEEIEEIKIPTQDQFSFREMEFNDIEYRYKGKWMTADELKETFSPQEYQDQFTDEYNNTKISW
jgi:hypothetical protein